MTNTMGGAAPWIAAAVLGSILCALTNGAIEGCSRKIAGNSRTLIDKTVRKLRIGALVA
jgi:hypothetical protein